MLKLYCGERNLIFCFRRDIMHAQKFAYRRSLPWVAGLMFATLMVSCDRVAQQPPVLESPETTVSPTEPAPQQQEFDSAQTPDQQGVEVYWLDARADTIQLVPAPVATNVKSSEQPEEALEVAFQQLVAGPDNDAFVSEIPAGTELLGVTRTDNGVYVNLSEEFESGGGSMSMIGRLAQVIYTATSLNPDAPVWLQIDGNTLDVLGGEGLVLDQPMTRQSFEDNFPL
jgi:spore germination protein GerM